MNNNNNILKSCTKHSEMLGTVYHKHNRISVTKNRP